MNTSLPLFLTNTTCTAEDDQAIAPKMLELRELVENERWERSTLWEVIDPVDVATDFPVLTEEELRNVTLETYQVKMPKAYSYEHLHENGAYDILISNDVP